MFPVRKPEEKRYLVKPRLRWEDNIEMDLKEIFSESLERIYLAQGKNN